MIKDLELLDLEFLEKSTIEAAKYLIGKIIVRLDDQGNALGGIITETEAYLSEGDESSHSFCGKTKRNAAMFEKAGTIYVYKSYGLHLCMNIVSESEGIGAAVLLRSIEPTLGIEQMIINRKTEDNKRLCKGPGNLTKALGVIIDDNFKHLNDSNIYLYDSNFKLEYQETERIGISKSKELLLRFVAK